MEQNELEKLKPGAKVRFTSEEMHRREPKYYPVVGTVGKIVNFDKNDGAWVNWAYDHVKCKGTWHAPAFALAIAPKATRPQKILITVDKADHHRIIAKDLGSGVVGVAKCNPTDTFDFYAGAKLAFARLCGEDKPKAEQKPKCKFKVGDMIIGNKLANRYNTTREGWVGFVQEIYDPPRAGAGCDDGKYVTFKANGFPLVDDAFDLLKEPKGWNGKVVCVSNGKCKDGCNDFTIGKVYTVKDGKLDCDRHVAKYPASSRGENNLFERFEDIAKYSGILSKFVEYKGEA